MAGRLRIDAMKNTMFSKFQAALNSLDNSGVLDDQPKQAQCHIPADQSRSSGRLQHTGTRHKSLEQIAGPIIDEFDLRPCPQ